MFNTLLKWLNLPSIVKIDPVVLSLDFFHPHYCNGCGKGVHNPGHCRTCVAEMDLPEFFVCQSCLTRKGQPNANDCIYPRRLIGEVLNYEFGGGNDWAEYHCINCVMDLEERQLRIEN